MIGGFGVWELLIILVIVMILFGAKRLPDLAKGLGQGITEFKKAQKDGVVEDQETTQTTQSTSASASSTNKESS